MTDVSKVADRGTCREDFPVCENWMPGLIAGKALRLLIAVLED